MYIYIIVYIYIYIYIYVWIPISTQLHRCFPAFPAPPGPFWTWRWLQGPKAEAAGGKGAKHQQQLPGAVANQNAHQLQHPPEISRDQRLLGFRMFQDWSGWLWWLVMLVGWWLTYPSEKIRTKKNIAPQANILYPKMHPKYPKMSQNKSISGWWWVDLPRKRWLKRQLGWWNSHDMEK